MCQNGEFSAGGVNNCNQAACGHWTYNMVSTVRVRTFMGYRWRRVTRGATTQHQCPAGYSTSGRTGAYGSWQSTRFPGQHVHGCHSAPNGYYVQGTGWCQPKAYPKGQPTVDAIDTKNSFPMYSIRSSIIGRPISRRTTAFFARLTAPTMILDDTI